LNVFENEKMMFNCLSRQFQFCPGSRHRPQSWTLALRTSGANVIKLFCFVTDAPDK